MTAADAEPADELIPESVRVEPIDDEESEAELARRADAELEARAKARLGAVLRDKYRLDYVLGSGGAATVYAATHRNGSRVALKLLHPELASEPEVRARFLREGYVANKVKHAGAVAVIDDDVTEEGWAFLVMDLLVGMTAHGLWEAWSFRLNPALVTAITIQILDVMESAHANGIVHRDLKPDNIFLTPQGEAKVLDFGIARVQDGGARKTNVGAVLGTPAFMAPEQAASRSRDIDARTDIWAIGAIGFTLLVGDIVHPAENAGQILIAAATRPARPMGPLVPEVSPTIVAVFERALAFDRADRWGSAAIMREALKEAAAEAFGSVPSGTLIRDALTGLVDPPREVPPYDGSGAARRSSAEIAARSGISEVTAVPVDISIPIEESTSLRRPVFVGVAVAGILVAIAGLAAAFVLLRSPAASDPMQPPGAVVATMPRPEPVLTAAPPSTGAPPKLAATVPPVVTPSPSTPSTPSGSTASRAHGTSTHTSGGSRAPTTSAACTPPFVIAADGTKKWKQECL